MATQLRKSYRFAFRSALLITVLLNLGVLGLLFWGGLLGTYWPWLLVFVLGTFLLSFFVIDVKPDDGVFLNLGESIEDF